MMERSEVFFRLPNHFLEIVPSEFASPYVQRIFIIAATNQAEMIDPAVRRTG
jgi:SpoVK/Ycf46/Vps4 family AAA+-type ATPase